MKSKMITSAVMAVSLLAGSSAFAQNYDRHDDHRGPGPEHRDDRRHDDRGAGPNHEFHRGQRISGEYRNRQYVVDNWRGHHLNAPPRGYHWVQTGPDYVLVAITTGLIAQIVLGN
jgi:Ni/Co efflux regulator RcnB